MSSRSPAVTATSWLVLAAIVAVALNLRPILAATGPLLDLIQVDTGIDDQHAGLLTTLPVFAMGLCALWAAHLQRWFGSRQGIVLGVSIITLACAVRLFWYQGYALIITAAAGGLGIALVQALMPSFIKSRFAERASTIMGLYSTGIMGGAAFAAAIAPPVAISLGWSPALAIWALPALAALLLWMSQTQSRGPAPAQYHGIPWRLPRAWLLMAFFGIGTGGYTLALAWLSPYYTQLGWTPTESGLLLALLSIGEVIAGLTVSALVGRFHDRRPLLWTVLVFVLLGLAGLVWAPLTLAIPATLVLAFGLGSLFPLSLIITMDHADSPDHAGALLGFVQGGGYMIASAMPLIAGIIRGHFDDLGHAWSLMMVAAVVLMFMAARFRPNAHR